MAGSLSSSRSIGGRTAVEVSDGNVSITVLLGGGHIAEYAHFDGGVRSANPMWSPQWPTSDPSIRRLTVAANAEAFKPEGDAGESFDPLECELLASIAGHNLCFDVFGAHSDGEVARAGQSFHGEAGMVTWTVEAVAAEEGGTLTLGAQLPQSQLAVQREISIRPSAGTGAVSVVSVAESIINLTGIQRALGRAQHVSIGKSFLEGGALFASNATRGVVWPNAEEGSDWTPGAEFDYPLIPCSSISRSEGGADWRKFPRQCAPAGGICSLLIDPAATHGWFVAARDVAADALPGSTAEGSAPPAMCDVLAYRWVRADFPFLVTWEEDRSRTSKPWRGVTTVRGLEFSSYAFPKGRRWNVEQGTVLGAPSFEWLDARETKDTVFEVVFTRIHGRTAADVVAEESVAGDVASWFAGHKEPKCE